VREDEGKTKKRSIGIISLYHKAQATLIDRLLDEDDYISKNREKHAIRCGDAREFQGDERDIILLSLVIGAERFHGTKKPKIAQKLADFNVAVSRARYSVILFSSAKIINLHAYDMRCKLLKYFQDHSSSGDGRQSVCFTHKYPVLTNLTLKLASEGYTVTPIELNQASMIQVGSVDCETSCVFVFLGAVKQGWTEEQEICYMFSRLGRKWKALWLFDAIVREDECLDTIKKFLKDKEVKPAKMASAKVTPAKMLIPDSVVRFEEEKDAEKETMKYTDEKEGKPSKKKLGADHRGRRVQNSDAEVRAADHEEEGGGGGKADLPALPQAVEVKGGNSACGGKKRKNTQEARERKEDGNGKEPKIDTDRRKEGREENAVEENRTGSTPHESFGIHGSEVKVSLGCEIKRETDDVAAILHVEKQTMVEEEEGTSSAATLLAKRAADNVTLPASPHVEKPANAGENGIFGSQHLACVLNTAFHTLAAMKTLVVYLKTKSEVWKAGVQLSSKADGAYSKLQLAERIAECRPEGVSNAEELLSWLVVAVSSSKL